MIVNIWIVTKLENNPSKIATTRFVQTGHNGQILQTPLRPIRVAQTFRGLKCIEYCNFLTITAMYISLYVFGIKLY